MLKIDGFFILNPFIMDGKNFYKTSTIKPFSGLYLFRKLLIFMGD